MVKTQPRGAQVLKDGKFLGDTPLPVILKPGERLTIEQPGYHPETRAITAKEREIEILLRAKRSEEQLQTDPSGATVVMDGKSLPGTTPLNVAWNHAESHQLTFKSDRGDLSLARDFRPGETPGTQVFRLQGQSENAPPNAPGILRFPGTYPVRVRLDGKDLGEVRAGGSLSLPQGEHRLEVSNPKVFLQRSFTVQMAPGATRNLPLPEVVQLTVDTHPSSGLILVDGFATGIESDGNTPISLVKGTHVIVIQGAPRTRRTVDVDKSQKLSFTCLF